MFLIFPFSLQSSLPLAHHPSSWLTVWKGINVLRCGQENNNLIHVFQLHHEQKFHRRCRMSLMITGPVFYGCTVLRSTNTHDRLEMFGAVKTRQNKPWPKTKLGCMKLWIIWIMKENTVEQKLEQNKNVYSIKKLNRLRCYMYLI